MLYLARGGDCACVGNDKRRCEWIEVAVQIYMLANPKMYDICIEKER